MAVILSALNLRTAVTSVGALLGELDADLGMSAGQAGVLTALPLITFAVVGLQAAPIGRLLGEGAFLMGAMCVMTAGLAIRALATDPILFLGASFLALVGGAVGNVTIPAIIKARFPQRIGLMTAAYIVALAIGQSFAAGVSIPVARIGGGLDWRLGLGIWALLSLLAAVGWFATPRSAREHEDSSGVSVAVLDLARSRTVWLVTVYFALQAAQVFVIFGWFPTYFREAGLPADTAAALIALYSVLSIPISLLVPLAMNRVRRHKALLAAPAVCGGVAYLGMSLLSGGAWVWIVLAAAANAAFPAVLSLFPLRTEHARTTAALASFSQSVGYLLASLGPLVVGWLRGASGDWRYSFFVMVALAVIQVAVSMPLGRETYVEHELGTKAAAQ